ncbi:BlaI/MecI/CopY family transcriptional regulator [Lewinella sp. W8]|uniref:BlaI/MecI/CopY family transcriptional regulator n=1 Tax=Lewinella sp. W8 TaxID=2528208 RepID=UPI0010689FEF|nr:BlaI/MecI/CopY family transcriptional regulator [Lewinella sp. W8]MTB53469.1 BlaI/MecI/CopY family transcriptional regulator [Lewinella sp. W8]
MLTKAEEQLMKHLWEQEPCFMKDLLQSLPEPRPAKSTVATLLKRMIEKELVGYRTYGNSREYFSRVSKQAYFGHQLKGMISDFFGGAPTDLASLFVEETELNEAQLAELRRIIDRKLSGDDL